MGVTERKARERKEMRAAILAAARRIFVAEGWASVSIRRIAAEIEYSPGALYLYFRDKDELLGALLEEGFEALRARQEQALTVRDPLVRLKRHGEAYLDFALERPDFYELMFVIPISPSAAAKAGATGAASLDLLRRNVADCAAAGQLGADDAEAVTHAMWALVHGLASIACRARHAPNASAQEERGRAMSAFQSFFALLPRGE